MQQITGKVAEEILNECGLDNTELVYQVDDANDLLGMSTICGTLNNGAMTQEVINYISAKKKGHMYAVFSNDEGIQAGIIYMLVRVPVNTAEKIADMVYEKEGSFRPECDPMSIDGVDGYIAFESE